MEPLPSPDPSSEDAPASFAVGSVLAEKYRIDRIMGRGAMGVVVAATHLELDQQVAIKLLLPELATSGLAVERFMREARAAVQLKSAHVAHVIDVGRTPAGVPYMVMEYLDGSDLGAVLEQRGELSVVEAADYLLQVCEAVAEAHARGIVHRDLKPQNLFLTRGVGGEPLVKVLDFGISKSMRGTLSALTQVSTLIGSPLYMAPEQLRGSKDVDARTDIWALGVVLQELVTGRLPFEADSIPELTLRIAVEPAREARRDRPDLPDALVAILARCLAKDPRERFADVGALAAALSPLSSEKKAVRTRAPFADASGGPARVAPPSSDRSVSGARAMVIAAPPEEPRRRAVWLATGALMAAALVASVMVLRARTEVPARHEQPPAHVVATAEREAPAPPPVTSEPTGERAPDPPAAASVATPSRAGPRASPNRARGGKNDEIPSMR